MSHQLESMFYTQDKKLSKTPWHGLGISIDDDKKLSIKEGIEAAGLDWQVSLCPLQIMSHSNMIATGISEDVADKFNGCHDKFVNKFATVRMSDKSVLGVVGPEYVPVQNLEVFEWFQPFLDAEQATLETAGSLYLGAKVWVLAKLNRPPMDMGQGDLIEKFLLLSNSHDATQSVRVGFTPTRVVCANTLSLAHSQKQSNLIRIRHSSKVKENLSAIRDTVDTINQSFEASAIEYRKLMNRGINQNDLRKYCKLVIEVNPEIPDRDLPTRTQNRLDELMKLCNSGIGNDGKTWYSAYNGITEFLSHSYGRSTDARLDSLWFGVSATMNSKALKLALDMSA